MTLFLTMLPLYLLGNLHCIGMCGPLVLMIGRHRFRYYYFLGRVLSFTLAGTLAGGAGHVLNVALQQSNIAACSCLLFGVIMLLVGIYTLFGWNYPGHRWLSKRLSPFNNTLSLLMLKDKPIATFLFGFLTISLPCGQTVIVFSACAMSGDLLVGLSNGLAFALLTSPSLLLAMQAHTWLYKIKHHYNLLLGCCGIVVGLLSIFRGLADLGTIPHLVLNTDYHLVLY